MELGLLINLIFKMILGSFNCCNWKIILVSSLVMYYKHKKRGASIRVSTELFMKLF